MMTIYLCPECGLESAKVAAILSHCRAKHPEMKCEKSDIQEKEMKGGKKKMKKEEIEDDEAFKPDFAEKAALRGRLKQLTLACGKLTQVEKEILLPELTQIKVCLKKLSLKNLSDEDYEEIENLYNLELRPTIEGFCGKLDEIAEKDDDEDVEMDLISLKSIIMYNLRRIASSRKKDSLIEEKLLLNSLAKKLSKKSVTRETIEDVRFALESDVVPSLDALLDGTKSVDNIDEDDDDFPMEGISKKEYAAQMRKIRMMEMEERIAEAKERRRRREDGFGGLQQQQNALVPKTVMVTGEDGTQRAETMYVPAGQGTNENSLTSVLLSTVVSLLKADKGGESEASAQLRRDLEESRRREREAQAKAEKEREARHQQALEQIGQRLNSAMSQLSQNPFRNYIETKKEMIQMGFERNEAASAEEKSLQMAKDVFDTGVEKIDRRGANLEKLILDYGQLQLEHMKNQTLQNQPQMGGKQGVIAPVIRKRSEDGFIHEMQGLLGELDENE